MSAWRWHVRGLAAIAALGVAPLASASVVERLEFGRRYERGLVRQAIGVDGSGPRWVDALDTGPSPIPTDDPFKNPVAYVRYPSPDARGYVERWYDRYGSEGLKILYDGRVLVALAHSDPGASEEQSFAWAPDSSAVVLAEAFRVDGSPDTGRLRIFAARGGAVHDGPRVYLSPLAWAPDSSRLVGVRADDPTSHLDVVTAAGSAAGSVDLPAGPAPAEVAWFPTGDAVVVGSAVDGARRLVRVRVADGEATELSPAASAWTFGPDGRRIALVEGGYLSSVAGAGGDHRPIIGGASGPLAWSPRGDRIAYVRAGRGIGLVAPDGSRARLLTARLGDEPRRFLPPAAPAADATPPRAVIVGRTGRRALSGWFTDAAGSAGIAGVRIRVVRVRAGACAAWTGSGYRATPCGGRGRGVEGTLSRGPNGPRWRVLVRFAPGRYAVQAVATDRAGNVDGDAPIVRFRIRG